ncbi:MAG: NUDIX domain-containing protein [Acidimicrobiales bacterium]
MSGPGRFRRLGTERVWQGVVIGLDVDRFAAPDGTEFTREVVRHPGAVSVVPVRDDGRVLLVRQYRAALDGELLEIPAGKRDVAGEAPEITAARELEEEVGMRAGRLVELGRFFNSAGFCDEHSIVYLATGLTACPTTACGVEEEHMTIEDIGLDEVPLLIADGTLVDAKSIIGLLLAREHLSRECQP